MIEQVLYRRTVEQGYNEYCSRGLSKEEAHRVNVVMDTVASDIGDLGSGADSPFMIYPFETMHRFCLATFQREFSKGRSNSVNHGLLIEEEEYRELVKNPEQLWGFTNKSFLSRKVSHREEMFALKALDISDNPELSKDFIFSEYNLNNDGFLQFLNAVYTSLSKNKNYLFGLRIDNSKDANKAMRHLGYLIMSMLPYELRDKVSFCSRSTPDSVGVAVQILQEKDAEKDITYDIATGVCSVNNPSVEVMDFYLNDLLSMSDAALRDYFGILDAFKNDLKLSEDSEAEYVISKLLKLSQKPSMFASETAETQFTFINDVFSLPTSNTDVINSIVVRLLPFVDANHYMEAFNINFGLYRKLNSEKESDRQIMTQIEENLVQNYTNATAEEKKELFGLVFKSEEIYSRVAIILEKFVEINNIELDSVLVSEYIKLYEEFFESEWKSALYWKIVNVFKECDIPGKVKIWNRMCNSANPDAKNSFIYNILRDEDEPFHKVIFDALVDLFIKSRSQQIKERCLVRINDVIHKEDDNYRVQIIQKYNDEEAVESSLWLETYNAIEDYQRAATNVEFLKCLRDKYYNSSNPEVCDLYLDYIGSVPVSELESIIRQYSKQTKTTEREDFLLNKVIYFLTKDKKKVSISVLKILAAVVKEDGVNELASYISNLYLSTSSDSSMEVYDFLETEQPRLYNNPYLHKEYLPSYDSYLASKLNKRILKDDSKLVAFIKIIEQLQYHEECFTKINAIYQKWIDEEISSAEDDYERYLKCKGVYNRLLGLTQTQFGSTYYKKLLTRLQNGFWKESSITSFDYEHCAMYKSDSIVFNQQFKDHENHVLAENLSGLIEDSYIDWDKVYEILLSKKYIAQDAIRNQIIKDFNKKYNEYGMSKSDPDYIAFVCVNKNNFKMDYDKLFELLQKYNYRVDEKTIHRLKIFEYIRVSDQLRKLVSQYNNYQSDNPSYGEVVRGLLLEQIAVLVLLIANNVLRTFAIKMTDNLKTRDLLLLGNCGLYILLIVLVALVSVVLMKRANMRRSTKYDTMVFGMLIVNMVLSAAAIVLSARFSSVLICLPVSVVFMVIAIILTLKVGDTIGRPQKSAMRRGDDIYE